ncbi:type II secretion system protein [Thalassoroseus pseudoceratinae]|uniref:type II secretion system protein n=1 Tax=Thalassoroseus pseudoceratinae TaxID=2713176 RepID=UPI0014206A0C|nr:prepilin-type N-terminal cleavage/methylation domain-containing protein [Thalassoroseus pseudoceratinae]
MKTQTQPAPLPRQATGFTLIELLIVIVILGILMSLILPAISSARRNARVAQVSTEIKSLESGLENFKAKFDFYPPSTLVLHETGANWNTPAAAPHRAIIRRMFPQFDFADHDFNGNGNTTDSFSLTGNECLVFFLGGMADQDGDNFAMIGFSKNPANPFTRAGSSRLGPFTEFETGRLVDNIPSGGNGFPEYVDPLPNQTAPYGYLSANNGRGYAAGTMPYRLPGEDANLNNTLDASEDANSNSTLDVGQPFKPDSYQIVSPGFDNEHGTGGTYDPETADAKLGYDANPSTRSAERDNITNFHPGMLAD